MVYFVLGPPRLQPQLLRTAAVPRSGRGRQPPPRPPLVRLVPDRPGLPLHLREVARTLHIRTRTVSNPGTPALPGRRRRGAGGAERSAGPCRGCVASKAGRRTRGSTRRGLLTRARTGSAPRLSSFGQKLLSCVLSKNSTYCIAAP